MPSLELETAYAHVEAAQAVATEQVGVELLLGIAYVESRFDPTALSRVEGTTRRTGRYPSTTAPARLNRRASMFCGPLQTHAPSWSRCLAMRDLKTGYAAAVQELEQWLRDRRVRGSVARALAGHGCGNFGVLARGAVTRSCNGYPGRVLAMERQFRLGTPPRVSARRGLASS